MNEYAPLTRRCASARPDVVLDGRLALSEHGLALALRLARDRRVWIGPSLWSLMEQRELAAYPQFADAMEDARAFLPALGRWHAAWLHGDRLDPLCWIGEHGVESRLPEGFDRCAKARLERFAVALERRAHRKTDRPITRMAECARDSAALAALDPAAPSVVLTTPGDEDGAVPRLVALLGDAEVACRRVERPRDAALARAAGLDGADLGLAQLMAAGMRAVAVHVVAPGAATAFDLGDDALDVDDDAPDPADDPWADAVALWHEIG